MLDLEYSVIFCIKYNEYDVGFNINWNIYRLFRYSKWFD